MLQYLENAPGTPRKLEDCNQTCTTNKTYKYHFEIVAAAAAGNAACAGTHQGRVGKDKGQRSRLR